jgi:hypothetical protein
MMRTCPGGACERKTDCRRWLERNNLDHAETFRVAPYALARKDAPGRTQMEQRCEYFVERDT